MFKYIGFKLFSVGIIEYSQKYLLHYFNIYGKYN